MYARSLYGTRPSAQPTSTRTPPQRAGEPEPTVRKPTPEQTAAGGLMGNPTFWLVALVGLAIFLVTVSVRGSFEVRT